MTALLAAACSSPSGGSGGSSGNGSSASINFDAVVDLTGAYGQYGEYDLAGLKADIAVINDHGGVLGKKLELHYLDDQSEASQAYLDAEQLLSQYPATFLDAGTVTPTCDAILPVTTRDKVISFCSGSFPPGKYPYAFGVAPDPSQMAASEAEALKDLGATKVALITDAEAGDTAVIADVVSDASHYGLKVVSDATTPVGPTDYVAQLQQAKSDDAQAILLHSVVPTSVIALMRDLETLNWTNVKVLVNDESVGTDVMENIPAAVSDQFNVVAPRIYLHPKQSSPFASEFVDQLAAEGPIADVGISAYHADAINLAVYAMKTAKTTSNLNALVNALTSTHSATIPAGTLLDFDNPEYSPSEHVLPNSAFTDYWCILRPGTPVQGEYQGETITVEAP